MTENYHDQDGNPITLHALVRSEPEWAVNVIRTLRSLLKEVAEAADACDKEAERPSQTRSSAPMVRLANAIERAREALKGAKTE